MAAVPAPFGFGQWTSHFTPTLLGAPAVVMERFNASKALELIERERVSVLCAVSTQFILMLNAPELDRYDLTSLRVMFTGGEMIPYERARDFERRTGATVLNFYGSNESGFATATTIGTRREKRLRTAGRVQPGTELRLYDDGATTSPRAVAGSPARGARRSRSATSTIAAANAELFTPDGFVLHADEVTLDAEGYLARGRPQVRHHHPRRQEHQRPARRGRGRRSSRGGPGAARSLARSRFSASGSRSTSNWSPVRRSSWRNWWHGCASAAPRRSTCRSVSSSWTNCPVLRRQARQG